MRKNWYHIKFTHGKDYHSAFIELEIEEDDELEDIVEVVNDCMSDIYEDTTGLEPIKELLAITAITLINSKDVTD